VLIAELLYKNYYKQSNRKDLLKAVHYFDSIVGMDGYGTDTRGVSAQKDAFLDARAHYINGAGYYERDSVVAACSEYLKALEIMETHFPDVEMRHGASLQPNHIPRFLCLTYSRLAELFSDQFMQEPSIVCCKKALAFNRIEQGSSNNQSSLLLILGNQYHKLIQYDSAEYYLDEALNRISITENLVYRDLVSQMALLNYDMGKGAKPSISDLKRMASQATSDQEKLVRFLTIGAIYYADKQYDSALAYLIPVFENDESIDGQKIAASEIREIYQYLGDTLKATPFAMFLAENTVPEGESNAQVSTLNELFQNHLKWEREKAEAERQQAEQEATQLRRMRSMVVIAVVLLVFGLGLWWWLAKRRKEHKAETQTLNEEKQHLQAQVDDALQQLQTQADDALQQARAMLPQRASDLYHSIVPNRLERIMDEFEAAYPKVMERLAAAHPELNERERQIAVLNFLRFRAKEEAELTGFAENTILKYRSNLNKKAGYDPISALIEE
jgi:tetratricopeptide (TPR) repeat protein